MLRVIIFLRKIIGIRDLTPDIKHAAKPKRTAAKKKQATPKPKLREENLNYVD